MPSPINYPAAGEGGDRFSSLSTFRCTITLLQLQGQTALISEDGDSSGVHIAFSRMPRSTDSFYVQRFAYAVGEWSRIYSRIGARMPSICAGSVLFGLCLENPNSPSQLGRGHDDDVACAYPLCCQDFVLAEDLLIVFNVVDQLNR